jgi:hypothetical protein
MPPAGQKTDQAVRKIQDALRRHYQPLHPQARIDVYRYNSASIRIRVIDPDFKDKDMTERDDEVWVILKKHVPTPPLDEVNLILLLTPAETKTSLMNQEFENPSRTQL